LDFTIYFKDTNGNFHHEWSDFISTAKQDYSFTFHALLQLAKIVNFSQFTNGVHIWSDNAFCNYGCLYAFWCLGEGYQIQVDVNFFALHHGYTLCDTHFGQTKQKIRTDFCFKLVHDTTDIQQNFQQLSNTTVTILEDIPKINLLSHFFEFQHKGI
jgi:hypothetical protein